MAEAFVVVAAEAAGVEVVEVGVVVVVAVVMVGSSTRTCIRSKGHWQSELIVPFPIVRHTGTEDVGGSWDDTRRRMGPGGT